MDRIDQLKAYLDSAFNKAQISKAIKLVKYPADENEGESFVDIIIDHPKAMPELIDAVLQGFLDLHQRMNARNHGYWVHSLSHFTRTLWSKLMTEWIKKFNDVAFKGANELGDKRCSDRLVDDFDRFAKYNDNPADFGLTPASLAWINPDNKFIGIIKARVEHGVFGSENELKLFKLLYELRNPNFVDWSNELYCDMVDLSKIAEKLKELRQLGGDVSEFDDLIKRLLEKHLISLEKEIQEITHDDKKQWAKGAKERAISNCRKGIEITQANLDTILNA